MDNKKTQIYYIASVINNKHEHLDAIVFGEKEEAYQFLEQIPKPLKGIINEIHIDNKKWDLEEPKPMINLELNLSDCILLKNALKNITFFECPTKEQQDRIYYLYNKIDKMIKDY